MDSEECDEADLIPKNCAHQLVFSFSFCNLDCFSEQGLQVDLLDRVFPLPLNLQPFYQVSNLLQIREMVKFSISLMINRLLAFIILYPYIWSLSYSYLALENSFLWSLFRFSPLFFTSFCVSEPQARVACFGKGLYFSKLDVDHIFFFFIKRFLLSSWLSAMYQFLMNSHWLVTPGTLILYLLPFLPSFSSCPTWSS